MGAMFSNLKGGPLWATVAIVVAIIGAATALTWHGTLSGTDWLAITLPILTGTVGVVASHTTGQAIAAAINVPAPATMASTPSVGTTAPAPPPAPAPTPAPTPTPTSI